MLEVNAVGKIDVEVKRAYLAGFIDGDGCIMATIERHSEKKFAREFKIGQVRCNRRNTVLATHDWVIRDRHDVALLLEFIQPYSRLKKKQISIALRILRSNIRIPEDLLKNAQLADTLSSLNVRSKNRRKNFATMIKIPISSND